jgi:hypothetical protein
MKYILTESQFALLFEDITMQRLKRRMTYENMEKFITNAEIDFPTLCDDFGDEFEYADNVISQAVYNFLTADEDVFMSERYDELHDIVSNTCKDWFGDYLIEIYVSTCQEEDDESSK